MSGLFSPITIRGVRVPNRVAVSPMCQYSAVDGLADSWHLVHLGARAVGGAGLVISEATAVSPEGRGSAQDTGLWSGAHVDAWQPVTSFIAAQGAVATVQLAHAGLKASTYRPWAGRRGGMPDADGGWQPVGPTDRPSTSRSRPPRPLDRAGVGAVVEDFAAAAERAVDAGFAAIEIHAAHGQLLHSFLSPLTNLRTDEYGGDLAGRTRLLLEVVRAVRAAVGEDVALFTRISAGERIDGGWTMADSVTLARLLGAAGVDLIDCSSAGATAPTSVAAGSGDRLPFAARVRRDAGMPTGAVGLITEPEQAEEIIATGDADLILLGRELLRDPYWPLRAAAKLGAELHVPAPYRQAF